ncbi:MFS transporter [Bacillus sp. ISL-53]|nr:MFS transporter [Bacillus sp. ISL-53]
MKWPEYLVLYSLLAGSYVGPVIAPIVTVYIYQYFGWQAVFYIFGLIGTFIAGVWYVFTRDYPEIHKLVNNQEKEYILEDREIVDTAKVRAP